MGATLKDELTTRNNSRITAFVWTAAKATGVGGGGGLNTLYHLFQPHESLPYVLLLLKYINLHLQLPSGAKPKGLIFGLNSPQLPYFVPVLCVYMYVQRRVCPDYHVQASLSLGCLLRP